MVARVCTVWGDLPRDRFSLEHSAIMLRSGCYCKVGQTQRWECNEVSGGGSDGSRNALCRGFDDEEREQPACVSSTCGPFRLCAGAGEQTRPAGRCCASLRAADRSSLQPVQTRLVPTGCRACRARPPGHHFWRLRSREPTCIIEHIDVNIRFVFLLSGSSVPWFRLTHLFKPAAHQR